jgi:glycosyltransferase involved in cell wall biosynthesis
MKAVFFVYVWPEPLSSAAGVRTLELCRHLRQLGYAVTFLSPCRENAASLALAREGVSTLPCPANDSLVEGRLKELRPDLVIYDRFVMEEQFGWRARSLWPDALHLVDTQDLHTVRRARERLLAQGKSLDAIVSLAGAEFSPDLERELASLYRADACLVVSPWEKEWLEGQGYPAARAFFLPFGAERDMDVPGFTARDGFASLGNFRHPPNLDGVRWLIRELWPRLRQTLPDARLHLYGAYPPGEISALGGKDGIATHGPVPDHRKALKKHRVLLAPLRYGAGIKGKVLEAWATGLAVVGTEVAMEGLGCGHVPAEGFVSESIRLHESAGDWQAAQERGWKALANFSPEALKKRCEEILAECFRKKAGWRAHPVTRMLLHHQHNSTKYFSLWIEGKNKK